MLLESIQLCHRVHGNGQYVHASPLQPVATGTIVRLREGKPTAPDGPFIETHEQLAGYVLIDAQHRDDAIRSAALVPGARIGSLEVRPPQELMGLSRE